MLEPSEAAVFAALSRLGTIAVAAGVPSLHAAIPANDWERNFLAAAFGRPGRLVGAIRADPRYINGIEQSAWGAELLEIVKDVTGLDHHASFLQWLVIQNRPLLVERCQAFLAAESTQSRPWVRPATVQSDVRDPRLIPELAVRYLRYRVDSETRAAIRDSIPDGSLSQWQIENHFSTGMAVRNILREAEFTDELLGATLDDIWADLLRQSLSDVEAMPEYTPPTDADICDSCNLRLAREELRAVGSIVESLRREEGGPSRPYVAALHAFDSDPTVSSAVSLLAAAPHLRFAFEKFTEGGEPLDRLQEALIRSGMGAAEALAPMIVARSMNDLHQRQFALRCELLFLVLHLTSRVAYATLGLFERAEIAKTLERVIPQGFLEGIIGHWPEERKRGVLSELFDNLNRAEAEYSQGGLAAITTLTAIRTDEGSVLDMFVANAVDALGCAGDAMVHDRALRVAVALWSELQLPTLVRRAASSSRLVRSNEMWN